MQKARSINSSLGIGIFRKVVTKSTQKDIRFLKLEGFGCELNPLLIERRRN